LLPHNHQELLNPSTGEEHGRKYAHFVRYGHDNDWCRLADLAGAACQTVVDKDRRWVGAGLLTLILVALTFAGGKGIATVYYPGAKPALDMTVAGTPEQIARGEYLVNLSCVGCHGAVDASGEPPLSGGWNIAEAEGFGFMGSMITENLTPGGKFSPVPVPHRFRTPEFFQPPCSNLPTTPYPLT
jgi:hypothetical protein